MELKSAVQILEEKVSTNKDELRKMNLELMNTKNQMETLKLAIYNKEMENHNIENSIIYLKEINK